MNIEFRSWDKVTKTMREVAEIDFQNRKLGLKPIESDEIYGFSNIGDGKFAVLIWRTFDDVELQQWTGLTDKNCTKIFDGDIVKICGNYFKKSIQENMLVIYDGKLALFGVVDALHTVGLNIFNIQEDFEVIGNKFETPKLLQEVK